MKTKPKKSATRIGKKQKRQSNNWLQSLGSREIKTIIEALHGKYGSLGQLDKREPWAALAYEAARMFQPFLDLSRILKRSGRGQDAASKLLLETLKRSGSEHEFANAALKIPREFRKRFHGRSKRLLKSDAALTLAQDPLWQSVLSVPGFPKRPWCSLSEANKRMVINEIKQPRPARLMTSRLLKTTGAGAAIANLVANGPKDSPAAFALPGGFAVGVIQIAPEASDAALAKQFAEIMRQMRSAVPNLTTPGPGPLGFGDLGAVRDALRDVAVHRIMSKKPGRIKNGFFRQLDVWAKANSLKDSMGKPLQFHNTNSPEAPLFREERLVHEANKRGEDALGRIFFLFD